LHHFGNQGVGFLSEGTSPQTVGASTNFTDGGARLFFRRIVVAMETPESWRARMDLMGVAGECMEEQEPMEDTDTRPLGGVWAKVRDAREDMEEGRTRTRLRLWGMAQYSSCSGMT
jgi:hypothetical protein